MRRNQMASYQKYIMMGVSTLLLPLAKKVLKKLVSRDTEEPQDDSDFEENDDFVPPSRVSNKRAG
jgi:hypothetical protein